MKRTGVRPRAERRNKQPRGEAVVRSEEQVERSIRNAIDLPDEIAVGSVRVLPPDIGAMLAAVMWKNPNTYSKMVSHVGPLDVGCTDDFQQWQVDGARWAFRVAENGKPLAGLAHVGLYVLLHYPRAVPADTWRLFASREELPHVHPSDRLMGILALVALGFILRAEHHLSQHSRAARLKELATLQQVLHRDLCIPT